MLLSFSRAQAAIEFGQPTPRAHQAVSNAATVLERRGARCRASFSLSLSLETLAAAKKFNNVFFSLPLARQGQSTPLLLLPAPLLWEKRAGRLECFLLSRIPSKEEIQASGRASKKERCKGLVQQFQQQSRVKRSSERKKTPLPPRTTTKISPQRTEKALCISPAFSHVSCRYSDPRARSDLSRARWNEKRSKRRAGSSGAASRMPPTKHRRRRRREREESPRSSSLSLFLSLSLSFSLSLKSQP